MTTQDESKAKSGESNAHENLMSTVSLMKKVLFSLLMIILALSAAFNLYLSYHNRRLNEDLDFYTAQVQKLSLRDQTLDRLFRDLVSYSEDNPDLKKLLNKYHILPDDKAVSDKEKKPNPELENLLGQQ